MKPSAAALGSGLLFGIGLGVSGMTSPAKVIGFLDFAGAWDASLAFVMIGAIAVHAILRRWVHRRATPLFTEQFDVPTGARIEPKLLLGSAVFGVGWGLAGYCPGPAIVSVVTGPRVVLFVVAMAVGMALQQVTSRASGAPSSGSRAASGG